MGEFWGKVNTDGIIAPCNAVLALKAFLTLDKRLVGEMTCSPRCGALVSKKATGFQRDQLEKRETRVSAKGAKCPNIARIPVSHGLLSWKFIELYGFATF